MNHHTPLIRRLAGIAGLALATSLLSPGVGPARADQPVLPLAPDDAGTFVIVPAAAELQLLRGPGVRRAHSIAPRGTAQWVGKKSRGRPVVSRLFYSFDLSAIPADAIAEVILEHWQTYSPNRTCYLESYGPPVNVVTTGAPGAKPRWPGPARTSAPVSSGFAVGSLRACVANRTQEWDVTEIVRSAARDSSTVRLRLASANEKKKSGHRRYDSKASGIPSLRVVLIARPDQPTHLKLDGVAPDSPDFPQVVGSATTALRADITAPGGCRGTTVLSTCLAARYELSTQDGTVVSAGLNDTLYDSDGVAQLTQPLGPLTEGTVYVAKVWGVNTASGLESAEPGMITFRYNAPPGQPEISSPGRWQLGQPIAVTVTAHDTDARDVCWEILAGDTPLTGCSPIASDEPTGISLGSVDSPASVNGTLWVVDDYGIVGTPAIIQGTVSW